MSAGTFRKQILFADLWVSVLLSQSFPEQNSGGELEKFILLTSGEEPIPAWMYHVQKKKKKRNYQAIIWLQRCP